MAVLAHTIEVRDGKAYVRVSLRDVVERLKDDDLIFGAIKGLYEENDALREALADLWPRAEFTMAPANRASWTERLRALGVEVDG